MTRKESDLQLCLDVKRQDRGKKRTKFDMVVAENVPFRCFKVLAQFKLPTFFGTAPTVQNYCTYVQTGVVVGKIVRNLKPRPLVAVAEPSMQSLDEPSNFCTIDSSH